MVVCVSGPAAGALVLFGGIFYCLTIALVVVAAGVKSPEADLSLPPELVPDLRRGVLTVVAGLAAMFVSAAARVAIFYPPLEVMYLLNALLLPAFIAYTRWLLRQQAAAATAQNAKGSGDAS